MAKLSFDTYIYESLPHAQNRIYDRDREIFLFQHAGLEKRSSSEPEQGEDLFRHVDVFTSSAVTNGLACF